MMMCERYCRAPIHSLSFFSLFFSCLLIFYASYMFSEVTIFFFFSLHIFPCIALKHFPRSSYIFEELRKEMMDYLKCTTLTDSWGFDENMHPNLLITANTPDKEAKDVAVDDEFMLTTTRSLMCDIDKEDLDILTEILSPIPRAPPPPPPPPLSPPPPLALESQVTPPSVITRRKPGIKACPHDVSEIGTRQCGGLGAWCKLCENELKQCPTCGHWELNKNIYRHYKNPNNQCVKPVRGQRSCGYTFQSNRPKKAKVCR